VSIFGVAEQEPRPENRVELSARVDADGVSMVRVYSGHSAKDIAALSEMIARCTRLAEAAGAEEIVAMRSSYDRVSATHVAGTCRMGRDPDMSVVDPYGQVHGVDNLFIADASVLVTQGTGDSPSLTIQALALRTAAHIARRLRK
jgi:choline dehydrogenase-like flavoprotein